MICKKCFRETKKYQIIERDVSIEISWKCYCGEDCFFYAGRDGRAPFQSDIRGMLELFVNSPDFCTAADLSQAVALNLLDAPNTYLNDCIDKIDKELFKRQKKHINKNRFKNETLERFKIHERSLRGYMEAR